MIKKLIALLFFLSGAVAVHIRAQSVESAVVNATGSTYSGSDLIFEWSVGELALVETMNTSKGIISNGFLQPVFPAHIITNNFFITPGNILTPNGDGKNDAWVIKDIEKYPDNEVTIFDRAGRVIYHTKKYQNDWTGSIASLPLSQDTYYYIIRLNKNNQTGYIKGFITILN